MSKFDALLTRIQENMPASTNPANQANNNPANQANKANQSQNNNQANQPQNNQAKPNQPQSNQQKPNYDQLMKDFNDPNKKINNLTDLKNYGINVN